MFVKEKLVFFMKMIARGIEEKLGLPSSVYFTKEDEKEIYSWDSKVASSIWSRVEESIYQEDISYESLINVFCFRYKFNCDRCSYGKRHGKCEEEGSDYKEIVRKANELQPTKLIKIILPSFWYKEVIDLINEFI